jgi:integrase
MSHKTGYKIVKPNQYLICRAGVYYLNLRISKPLITKYGSYLRISLKTDSVKKARAERDKIIGILRVEADELSTEGSNLRYQEILTNLRLDRDSAPDCFNILSPDSVNKENDKDYINAYITAVNEDIGLPNSDFRVKKASEQYQINIQECFKLFMTDHKNIKETAKKSYVQAIGFLTKTMQETPIHKLKRQEVKNLVQTSKLAFNTISGRVSRLKNMVEHAINEDKFDGKNPFSGLNVKTLTGDGETDSYQNLPPALHLNALKASEDMVTWEYLIHRLVPLTGLRFGEFMNITKNDISDGCLYIREGKTKNSIRQIPLTPLILALLAKCPSDSEYKFPTGKYRSSSIKISRNKSKWGWNTRHYSTHSYRGMLATALQEVGCPESDANMILGHKGATISFSLYSKNPNAVVRLRTYLEQVIDAPVMETLKAKLNEELNLEN